MARKREFPLYEKVEIIDAGSEGKAIARVNDRVIFVPWVMPGDIVDIKVLRKKKSFFEGKAVKFHHYSDKRTEPRCSHFGLCGGCKWQNMDYQHQLFYKQKQVEDNFQRLGKFEHPAINTILASESKYFYRNKLEYTFSNRKWFTEPPSDETRNRNTNALGFHMPQMFDRIVDIETCYLQADPSNQIRNELRKYSLEKELEFYDVKRWQGLMRNVIIRSTSIGELMVIVVFHKDDEAISGVMNFMQKRFPEITSLMYVVNEKKNDDISDQEVILHSGKPYIIEELPSFNPPLPALKFKIGPVSFFQTNSIQAANLYQVAAGFADFDGSEVVYDLYTGTGTIACYVAPYVKEVIGLEYVPSAIVNAKENAALNSIKNTKFFAGDILKIMDDEFVETHGRPDVIITDPPRAGMHEKVVRQIMKIKPDRIVYVSCNPATQARDIAILDEQYSVMKVQPVDMFPHTQHVENVALLKIR